ncbi:Syntaxin-112 [Platanthera guangdongensis]|uniref:Syntaxin-112 n=1 Tax=Platanthera guangdongensis TaxID=2320717 RepID=A0ABR2MRX0_9ASPA
MKNLIQTLSDTDLEERPLLGEESLTAPQGSFDIFLRDTATMREELEEIYSSFLSLRRRYEEYRRTINPEHDKEISREIYSEVFSILQKAYAFKKRVRNLRNSEADNHEISAENAEDRTSDDLVEKILSGSIPEESLFVAGQNLLGGNPSERLLEIHEGQKGVLELTKSLEKLQLLVFDFQMYLEIQGEALNNIEENVARAGSFISRGGRQLRGALREVVGSGRKCLLAILGLLAVLVIPSSNPTFHCTLPRDFLLTRHSTTGTAIQLFYIYSNVDLVELWFGRGEKGARAHKTVAVASALPRPEGSSGRPLRGGRLTLGGGGGGGGGQGCTARPRQRWWSALAGLATAKAARCGLSGKDGHTTRRWGRGRMAVVGPIAAKATRGGLGGDGGRPAWGQTHGTASGPTLVGPATAEAARCGLGGDVDRPMLGGRGHRPSLFTVR